MKFLNLGSFSHLVELSDRSTANLAEAKTQAAAKAALNELMNIDGDGSVLVVTATSLALDYARRSASHMLKTANSQYQITINIDNINLISFSSITGKTKNLRFCSYESVPLCVVDRNFDEIILDIDLSVLKNTVRAQEIQRALTKSKKVPYHIDMVNTNFI